MRPIPWAASRRGAAFFLVRAFLPALGLLLWLPAAARSQESPGERALHAISARFADLATFEADFTQTQSWVGSDPVESRGTLYIKRPNLFRLQYTEPPGHLQVSDGKIVWTYVPENGEVLTTKLDARRGQGGDLLHWVLETGKAEPELGREDLDGKPATVVTLVPDPGLGLSRVRLWTRPDSPEILQYELTDASGNVTLYRLNHVRRNPALPDTLFRFVPPKGVPVVELGTP